MLSSLKQRATYLAFYFGSIYSYFIVFLTFHWYRETPDDEQVDYLYDMKPDLSWHRFDRADFDSETFANGQQISIKMDFTPTSWLFKKGHKIRLSIAGADYTNFELHPTICPDNDLNNCKETVFSVHRGKGSFVQIAITCIAVAILQ